MMKEMHGPFNTAWGVTKESLVSVLTEETMLIFLWIAF